MKTDMSRRIKPKPPSTNYWMWYSHPHFCGRLDHFTAVHIKDGLVSINKWYGEWYTVAELHEAMKMSFMRLIKERSVLPEWLLSELMALEVLDDL